MTDHSPHVHGCTRPADHPGQCLIDGDECRNCHSDATAVLYALNHYGGDNPWGQIVYRLPGFDEQATDAIDTGQSDRFVADGITYRYEPTAGGWVTDVGPVDEDRPQWALDTIAALRYAGWAEPADIAAITGRSLPELVNLWESGHIRAIELGGWHTDGMPRQVSLFRLAEVNAAPARPPLQPVE